MLVMLVVVVVVVVVVVAATYILHTTFTQKRYIMSLC